MRQLYTGLAAWNLLVLLAFAVLASLQGSSPLLPSHAFQLAGFFMAFFCCLVQSLLVVHFIGTMKWIQQSGPTAGIDDTKPLRRAWIKGPMFPLVTICMLLAVATAILSGGAETGGVPRWIPVVLAWALVPLAAIVLVLARRSLEAVRARMDGVEAQMATRIESGAVAPEGEVRDELLPESGRAGGKVLAFLAINVWVLFVYMRFILRHKEHPVWPYAVASVLLLVVGGWMIRAHGRRPAPR